MITSIAVELVQLDHLSWQGPLGPRFCRGVAELGDDRHREPRQVSAVTLPFDLSQPRLPLCYFVILEATSD
jgi:hypothetical protein